MTNKLITVERAKKEIERLQSYINLVESYEADTLEKWIIKEYGHTNSLIEVTKRANDKGFTNNGIPIDKEFVKSVINGKASDPLHKLLKSSFKQRLNAIKKGRSLY